MFSRPPQTAARSRNHCRSFTTPIPRMSASTSSWSMDAVGRSTTSGGRNHRIFRRLDLIGLTATPRTPRPSASSTATWSWNTPTNRPSLIGVNVGYDVYKHPYQGHEGRGQSSNRQPGYLRSPPRPHHPQETAMPSLMMTCSTPAASLTGMSSTTARSETGYPHLPRQALHRDLPRPHRGCRDPDFP